MHMNIRCLHTKWEELAFFEYFASVGEPPHQHTKSTLDIEDWPEMTDANMRDLCSYIWRMTPYTTWRIDTRWVIYSLELEGMCEYHLYPLNVPTHPHTLHGVEVRAVPKVLP